MTIQGRTNTVQGRTDQVALYVIIMALQKARSVLVLLTATA